MTGIRNVLVFFLLTFCSAHAFAGGKVTAESKEIKTVKRSDIGTLIYEYIKKYPILSTQLNKFVLNIDDELKLSISGGKHPKHEVIGKGKKVITAGYVRFRVKNEKIYQIDLNNRSKAYCPSFTSLKAAEKFFQIRSAAEIFKEVSIVLMNQPNPDCKN